MSLTDRLLCRRNSNAVNITIAGQNENRHKTAFKTLSLLVNTKEIGPL